MLVLGRNFRLPPLQITLSNTCCCAGACGCDTCAVICPCMCCPCCWSGAWTWLCGTAVVVAATLWACDFTCIGGCGATSVICCCCCVSCSAAGRDVIGTLVGCSLPGSWGGGVCRLAAFCTGGPLEGSYCCWLCFCPVSCTAWGVGGIPPARQGESQQEVNLRSLCFWNCATLKQVRKTNSAFWCTFTQKQGSLLPWAAIRHTYLGVSHTEQSETYFWVNVHRVVLSV